jgi:hypothetical protein
LFTEKSFSFATWKEMHGSDDCTTKRMHPVPLTVGIKMVETANCMLPQLKVKNMKQRGVSPIFSVTFIQHPFSSQSLGCALPALNPALFWLLSHDS